MSTQNTKFILELLLINCCIILFSIQTMVSLLLPTSFFPLSSLLPDFWYRRTCEGLLLMPQYFLIPLYHDLSTFILY